MAGEAHEANAAQRRYWNTIAGPRWVAAPGFRERRNRESPSCCWRVWALPAARACSKSAAVPAH